MIRVSRDFGDQTRLVTDRPIVGAANLQSGNKEPIGSRFSSFLSSKYLKSDRKKRKIFAFFFLVSFHCELKFCFDFRLKFVRSTWELSFGDVFHRFRPRKFFVALNFVLSSNSSSFSFFFDLFLFSTEEKVRAKHLDVSLRPTCLSKSFEYSWKMIRWFARPANFRRTIGSVIVAANWRKTSTRIRKPKDFVSRWTLLETVVVWVPSSQKRNRFEHFFGRSEISSFVGGWNETNSCMKLQRTQIS